MKQNFIPLVLIMSLLIFIPSSDTGAGQQLTEQQALDILAEQIKNDKLYNAHTAFDCLLFITESKARDYFDFAIREKHGGTCPGDPNTSPVIDRFRINRISKKIEWFDVVMAQFIPYGTMLETRAGKTQ